MAFVERQTIIKMKVSLQKLYEILLEILLIILPVNYMIFNVILVKFYFLKYSKDIIMVLIIMLGALISKKKAQHMLNEHLTFLFYIVFYV